MSNTKKSQHSFKIIKRFGEDIWGLVGIQSRPSNTLNFIYETYQNDFRYRKLLQRNKKNFFLSKRRGKFSYKLISDDKEFKRKKRSLKTNNYITLLKLRRFYGSIRANRFNKRFKKLQLPVNKVSFAFAYFLESRLDVVLYRSNLFTTIYSARQYINHSKVLVNGRVVNKPGFILKVDDIITVSEPSKFYTKLKGRLGDRNILGNYPAYLEVNYKLGCVVLCQFPALENIPYPFFLDVSILTNSFSR